MRHVAALENSIRHVIRRDYPSGQCSITARHADSPLGQVPVPHTERSKSRETRSRMTQPNETPRRYPRYKGLKPVPVAWMHGTQKSVSKAENLSLGGLFIGTQNPPPMGALVLLLFHTPEGEVRVRSTVKNVKPGQGMGLAIT